MRRGRHGQHGGGDVLGRDSFLPQLVQMWRVHVLVVVPPEAVEGDEEKLVPHHRPLHALPSGRHRCGQEQKHGQSHLHLDSN